MDSQTLQKRCGYIIYIKSIIVSLFAMLGLGLGIKLCQSTNDLIDSSQLDGPVDHFALGCTALLGKTTGFSLILIGVSIFILCILYFILGRKLVYKKTYQKKFLITALIIEAVCSFVASEHIVVYLFSMNLTLILVAFVVIGAFLAQSIYTIYLIIKTMELHRDEMKNID